MPSDHAVAAQDGEDGGKNVDILLRTEMAEGDFDRCVAVDDGVPTDERRSDADICKYHKFHCQNLVTILMWVYRSLKIFQFKT